MDKSRSPTHVDYPAAQTQSPDPKTGYPVSQYSSPVPPTDYPAAGPDTIPVQVQPRYIQPGAVTEVQWMQAPARPLNCPAGLEYLMQIDQVLVHQEVSIVEALTDFQSKNRYEIKNRLGQKVFLAVEDSECCSRNCWDALRPFTMRILDHMGQEVITMERPLKCTCCCSPCCLQKIQIQAPRGVPIGYVAQIWHPFLPKFKIQNEKKEDVLKICGPFFVCNCGGDVDFHIKSLDEASVIGRISKQWSGCMKEMLTDADSYEIHFPLDLDVKLKAVLLGACLLVAICREMDQKQCCYDENLGYKEMPE